MSDKPFLVRWSRRKQADRKADRGGTAAPSTGEALDIKAEIPPDIETSPPPLPPIAEITATTDISVFMHKAVPEALRTAALRRMWSIDPAIRDFVSEAVDYAWDFHADTSVSGWGRLGPADDVVRMLNDLTEPREAPRDPPPAADQAVAAREPAVSAQAPPSANEGAGEASPADDPTVPEAQRGDAGATPRAEGTAPAIAGEPASPPPIRRHGGALPV